MKSNVLLVWVEVLVLLAAELANVAPSFCKRDNPQSTLSFLIKSMLVVKTCLISVFIINGVHLKKKKRQQNHLLIRPYFRREKQKNKEVVISVKERKEMVILI